MSRRTVGSMTDEELTAERRKFANMPGKYAARRFARILDEQIRRETQQSGA